jgi:type I restriction enzyme, S subunit
VKTVPLRRIATLTYGDALASENRRDGATPVFSSGGHSGFHDCPNSQGPVIVVGRKGSHGSVWWSDEPAFVIDTAYSIDASNTDVDLHWLYYVLTSLDLSSVSNDVGVPGLSRELVYATHVPAVLGLDGQRRIAGFLDAQVHRVDNLVSARQNQKRLLREHFDAAASGCLARHPRNVPLRRLISEAVVGIVVQPARLYEDSGVPALRGLDVKERMIARHGHVTLSAEGHAANPRSHLRRGDVVVVRTGEAGSAAVVPEWAEGWNCIDLVVVRASPGVSPAYLETVINAAKSSGAIGNASSGALHQHFGVGALRNLRVPDLDLDDQVSIATAISDAWADMQRHIRMLDRSIRLLTEYKQALITAAVRGEYDVTTAMGRGMPGADA